MAYVPHKLYWLVCLLSLTSRVAVAQLTYGDLSRDPVFSTILTQRLKYPHQASWYSLYARIYVGFSIDERGRVQQISVVNHVARDVRFGFEHTVVVALKKLPSLRTQYTGHYLLPVAFIYVDYRYKGKPYVPEDTLYESYVTNRVVLDEIKVFGNSVNSRERVRAAARNEAY